MIKEDSKQLPVDKLPLLLWRWPLNQSHTRCSLVPLPLTWPLVKFLYPSPRTLLSSSCLFFAQSQRSQSALCLSSWVGLAHSRPSAHISGALCLGLPAVLETQVHSGHLPPAALSLYDCMVPVQSLLLPSPPGMSTPLTCLPSQDWLCSISSGKTYPLALLPDISKADFCLCSNNTRLSVPAWWGDGHRCNGGNKKLSESGPDFSEISFPLWELLDVSFLHFEFPIPPFPYVF